MKIRTSIKNNKNLVIFFLSLFILGIITGIVMFLKQPDITKTAISIELSNLSEIIMATKQNQIFFHAFIILIIFTLNFTVIGSFANFFYLFYEGCSLGFSLTIFAYKFKFSGFIFGIIFNLITKFLFILLVFYVCVVGIKIAKRIVGSVVLKRNEITYFFLKKHFLILGIVLSICLINEVLIYFFANKILTLLLFLL